MHIKLKTKMMILFLAIILVPLLCGITVFMGYGYYENIDILHELSKKDIMIGAMVNRRLLQYMVVAMVVILILTSGIITAWLNRDVYRPLKELSVAMQHISVGDFDYHMNGGRGDEIGLLFENYEQMRLQLKESEEEKAQNEKKSKELVSNISHDLKTPITSIKGYVEGIMDGVANTPEKMDKYIKTIYNKANDMDRLINELTTYSGIDSNRIPYHFNILNVSDYFSDCVEEVGLDLEAKNIHLDFTNLVPAGTCVVADLRANFNGECTEVGMYLAMARVAHREGYPEIGLYWEKAAWEEAEHAAKFAELLGEVVTDSTKKNLEMRVEAENGATAGKFDLAKRAKAANLDAIHDTVHEMARDEARHGKAFEVLLKRYFG